MTEAVDIPFLMAPLFGRAARAGGCPRSNLREADMRAAVLATAALTALRPSAPRPGPAATPPADPGPEHTLPQLTANGLSEDPRAALVDGLRSRIRTIERHAPRLGCAHTEKPPSSTPRWDLGAAPVDALLPKGLETNGVHEVKAVSYGAGASASDWMAALGFSLRLAVRRTEMVGSKSSQAARAAPWFLWCWPRALAAEFGHPCTLGLAQLGLDPGRMIIVETPRAADALNALEEGLKSSRLALAFGLFDDVALTAARRLSLAAGAEATPCLLITHPASPPAGATATRWRVERRSSAPHPFDPRAPGNARFSLSLERCRANPESAATPQLCVEWSDATRDFSVFPPVAGRAFDARTTGRSAGRSAVRAG